MMNRTTAGNLSISLATRFLLAFIGAAVLPLMAVGAFGIASSYSAQRAQIEELQREAARNAANVIDAYLEQIEDEMALAARGRSLEIEEARRMAFLDTLLAYNAGFETLTLMDETGQEIAKTSRYLLFGPEDYANRADSPEFLAAIGGDRYLSPISISPYAEPLVTLAIPIRSVRGEMGGVLSAEVNLKYMWDIIARIGTGRGGYAYVVDSEGRLIAHRDSSLVLQGRNLGELQGVHNALLGQVIIGPYMGLEEQKVMGNYQPLRRANWTVLVETPTRQALANVRRSAATSVAAMVLALALTGLLGWYMAQTVVQPLRRLQEGAETIGGGDLSHRIDIQSRDEIGALANAFNAMAAQLHELIGTLEQRVADRTRGLQAAAEVAHAITSVLDPGKLLRQVVNLARERFSLYYVGLFLLDKERRFAVLRAGTGKAGQQMLAQRHRLEAGGESMIGQCVARAEARIALDVGEEAIRFDNPFLPETRSEMALPLRSRGRVIGAMTVQSVEEAAFDETDVAVLQTMADQVAVAIDNTQLFAEAQAALKEIEATQRRYMAQAWTEYTRGRALSGYEYSKEPGQTEAGTVPLGERVLPEIQQAVTERRLVVGSGDGETNRASVSSPAALPGQARELAIQASVKPAEEPSSSALVTPIVLRGQPIGALGLKDGGTGQQWSAEDIALAETISEQFALAAENLRLLDETQRRAARERLISEVTARMRETLNLETVLRTAVREIGRTLELAALDVRLGTQPEGIGE